MSYLDRPISLNHNQIENVKASPYLGITIDQNLNFNKQSDNICNKANRALGALKKGRTFSTFFEISGTLSIENVGTWSLRNIGTWSSGNMGTWSSGNVGRGIWEHGNSRTHSRVSPFSHTLLRLGGCKQKHIYYTFFSRFTAWRSRGTDINCIKSGKIIKLLKKNSYVIL